MTQGLTKHIDLERHHNGARPADDASERLGGLLERVLANTVRLLADVPVPPSMLRVRAGEVSVEVEWEHDAAAPAAVPTAPPEPANQVEYLTAPTVGVFYPTPEPGAAPFVGVGDLVTNGQQIGIVEAMKLMIPVEADKAGRITDVLKGHGEPVEFGEPLFTIIPDGGDPCSTRC